MSEEKNPSWAADGRSASDIISDTKEQQICIPWKVHSWLNQTGAHILPVEWASELIV
jgi:hypothetical protein